jgi:biofilm protein TabA
MIVTDIAHIPHQAVSLPALQTALKFLSQEGVSALPEGRIEIDGSRIYALIQAYNSKPETSNPRFEAHQRYLDIQYVISGKEFIGWAPLEQLVPEDPYNPDKDVVKGCVFQDAITLVRVSAGQAAILFPEDAHAPGLADGDPAPVKKIVIKVALDS